MRVNHEAFQKVKCSGGSRRSSLLLRGLLPMLMWNKKKSGHIYIKLTLTDLKTTASLLIWKHTHTCQLATAFLHTLYHPRMGAVSRRYTFIVFTIKFKGYPPALTTMTRHHKQSMPSLYALPFYTGEVKGEVETVEGCWQMQHNGLSSPLAEQRRISALRLLLETLHWFWHLFMFRI